MSTIVYIMNRTPTVAIHDVTPKEKYTGNKPDVSHFKVFGCITYVHVPDELRTKLDPKAEKCVFIGYSLEQKRYRCYNPATRQLRVSRDVVFDEMSSWYNARKVLRGADLEENVSAENGRQESQALSGRGESSCSKSVNKPWSGQSSQQVQVATNVRQKGKEKVGEPLVFSNVSAGHSVVLMVTLVALT